MDAMVTLICSQQPSETSEVVPVAGSAFTFQTAQAAVADSARFTSDLLAAVSVPVHLSLVQFSGGPRGPVVPRAVLVVCRAPLLHPHRTEAGPTGRPPSQRDTAYLGRSLREGELDYAQDLGPAGQPPGPLANEDDETASMYDTAVSVHRQRDSMVAAHLPAIITVYTREGQVVHQNPASVQYMGHMPAARPPAAHFPGVASAAADAGGGVASSGANAGACGPSHELDWVGGGVLGHIFSYEQAKLHQMLDALLSRGSVWQGIVRVPTSSSLQSKLSYSSSSPAPALAASGPAAGGHVQVMSYDGLRPMPKQRTMVQLGSLHQRAMQQQQHMNGLVHGGGPTSTGAANGEPPPQALLEGGIARLASGGSYVTSESGARISGAVAGLECGASEATAATEDGVFGKCSNNSRIARTSAGMGAANTSTANVYDAEADPLATSTWAVIADRNSRAWPGYRTFTGFVGKALRAQRRMQRPTTPCTDLQDYPPESSAAVELGLPRRWGSATQASVAGGPALRSLHSQPHASEELARSPGSDVVGHRGHLARGLHAALMRAPAAAAASQESYSAASNATNANGRRADAAAAAHHTTTAPTNNNGNGNAGASRVLLFASSLKSAPFPPGSSSSLTRRGSHELGGASKRAHSTTGSLGPLPGPAPPAAAAAALKNPAPAPAPPLPTAAATTVTTTTATPSATPAPMKATTKTLAVKFDAPEDPATAPRPNVTSLAVLVSARRSTMVPAAPQPAAGPAPEDMFSTTMTIAQPSGAVHGGSFHDRGPQLPAGAAGDNGNQPDGVHDIWHEVSAVSALDPVTGAPVLVVTQVDVTAKVRAERHLVHVMCAERRLLLQLFPRHVLQHVVAANPLLNTGAASLESLPREWLDGGDWRPVLRDCDQLATMHPQATVLFADIAGFDDICMELPPQKVLAFLNDLFAKFDSSIEPFGVHKMETIGGLFIVAGGLLREEEDGAVAVRERWDPLHAEKVFMFAKAMLNVAAKTRLPGVEEPVKLRIGIHTGPVMSGIVGTRVPRFVLFGDSVNTASRMQTSCTPGTVHVSEDTRALLPLESWTPTGGVQIKGKGLLNTYVWAPEELIHYLVPPPPSTPDSTLNGMAGANPAPGLSALLLSTLDTSSCTSSDMHLAQQLSFTSAIPIAMRRKSRLRNEGYL